MEKLMYEQIKEKASWCLNCKKPKCVEGCPLSNNIPGFIEKIKEDKFKEAYDILSETTILQPICGLICPYEKQCQGSCIRGVKGKPVQIGDIEAFIGKLAIENNWYKLNIKKKTNKKVAIIGGGPAGITCSAYLAKKGYQVTIYEKHNKLGGLLVYGIPEFRLEKKLVENWISKILSLGINVEYNKELGKNLKLEEIQKCYDAIFICVGANKSIKIGVDGEELDGVYGANELLETRNHPDYNNKIVTIIGGGNVALDTARIVNKLGAKKVYIVYRRAEKQMPAERKEIEDAKKEGIEFLFQNNIVKITGEKTVKAIELIRTELIRKDGELREIPINIKNSNYELNTDYLIRAIGSQPEENNEYKEIAVNNNCYIIVDEGYKTSKDNIFAGGDIIGGKSTVAYAARSSLEAAKRIDEFLQNK